MLLSQAIFERHGLIKLCNIERSLWLSFLVRVESSYGSHKYHNRCHGADVMLGAHLFVTKLGITSRMSHVQVRDVEPSWRPPDCSRALFIRALPP